MENELLVQISDSLRILVLLNVLTFTMSCMRSWRTKTLNLGGK